MYTQARVILTDSFSQPDNGTAQILLACITYGAWAGGGFPCP